MVFLLRHGAVQKPGGGKHYIGHMDLPLNDVGRELAHWWADHFLNAGLKKIYSSDLTRCLETARIIGDRCSLEPRALTELREICLGEWEGKTFDTIKTLYPQESGYRGDHIADHRPAGGESFRDLQTRVEPIFREITHQHAGSILIVTHAGVIRVLMCGILGMPLENLFSIGQSYGALNIIEVRPNGYRIHGLNLLPNEPASKPLKVEF